MNPPRTPLAVLLNPRVQTVWAAREVGARTLMVGPDLTAPGMKRLLAEADEALEADWRSHARLTEALAPLAGCAQVAVFGFDDATAPAAARVNWALRLPGSSPLAVAVLGDPTTLRERVNQITRTPVRYVVCEPAELARAACQVGFPCVVRTRGAAAVGGHGRPEEAPVLHGVIDAEELGARLPETELVVEEYLDGPRLRVEAHSYHGSHTVVSTTPPICGGLDEETVPEVHRLVTDTLDAADYLAGPSEITVALTGRGPRLVRARPCPGADSALPGYAVAALLELAAVAPRVARAG